MIFTKLSDLAMVLPAVLGESLWPNWDPERGEDRGGPAEGTPADLPESWPLNLGTSAYARRGRSPPQSMHTGLHTGASAGAGLAPVHCQPSRQEDGDV